LTNFRNKYFHVISTVGLTVFFNLFTVILNAFDLPVNINCKDKVCDCIRIEKTVFDIEQITKTIVNGSIKDSILIACCYHQIAIEYYYEFNDDLNSLKYNKKAEKIRSQNIDGLLWRTNLNIGINYYDLFEYKRAILYLEKALKINGMKESSDSIAIYRNLAECYMDKGDFDTAINFAIKSININADQFEMNTSLNALSSILINSKDSINIVEAIEYSKKTLQLCRTNVDYENEEIALNNLARAHKMVGKLNKAIKYYQQAIKVTDKTEILSKAVILNNVSIPYKGQKKYDLSIDAIKKSFDIYKKFYQTNYNFDYSANFENLGDIYFEIDSFENSLIQYQKSLINLTNNFRDENIFQNPNSKDRTLFIYSNPDMIRVLHLKATAALKYYQQNSNQEEYLTLANQTYQTAFNIHDQLQKDISTENSRLFQAKNILAYIENALGIAYQQQQNGQDVSKAAFRFMEKNKATVLLQSMNEADALKYANLPDSLLEQEKDLKIAITFHQKKLNEAIEYEDTLAIERIDKILFDEKQEYRQLIDDLEKNHPKYYRLKYQQNQTHLTDVQKQLNNKTSILSYFVGDSSIYTLLILKDSTQLFKTKKPAEWNNTIKDFRDAITLSDPVASANPYTKKLYYQYAENARSLYQLLLKEPLNKLDHIPHLTIIPDAELNYIPFDLLLKDKADTSIVNYKTLPYFLKEKTLSYVYSATLMMEQLQNSDYEKSHTYGGYAPHYLDTINTDIPKIRKLVNEMATAFNGKAYLKDKATKTNFLKDTLKYKILHFAMHGKLDDQNPLNSHLVFSQNTQDTLQDHNKLFAADLYSHQLNTDLAVLSACETGTGTLQKGEGVMSLSRAFTYSGCPSLVMSLWSIPEKSTIEVLRNFFKNIKSGKSKDISLQQAKLDYLENTPATLSHPVYWSGLVLTGNTKAIQFKRSLSSSWWIFGLLLVLFGGYLGIKKFNKAG